jgi:phage repressor protein C with HTH and peptisase S24 domain
MNGQQQAVSVGAASMTAARFPTSSPQALPRITTEAGITSNVMNPTIKAGDVVHIKPEWQDKGDDQFVWIAIEDEDGGRVRIQAQCDLPIKPVQVVTIEMLAL